MHFSIEIGFEGAWFVFFNIFLIYVIRLLKKPFCMHRAHGFLAFNSAHEAVLIGRIGRERKADSIFLEPSTLDSR